MSFKDAIVTCLKDKYCCFTGRARRSEYWFFFLFNGIISAVVGVLANITGNSTAIQVVSCLINLALLLPGLGVTVRRLHDIGKNWPYIFMSLIPIAGIIIMIVKCAQPGDVGANAYGDDPKMAA